MSKKIEIEVFEFDELSEEAKNKAINKLSSINVEYDWWESTYEDAKNIGLKLTTFDLDRNLHAKGEFMLAANEVVQNILNEHGKSCETYKTTEAFMEKWRPIFNKYLETEEGEDDLLEIESEFLNNLLEDYATILQNECDYLQSKESIIETIKENEYTFRADGTIFNG